MRAFLFLFTVCLYNLQTGLGQSEFDIEHSHGSIHGKIFGLGMPILIINGGPGMNSDGFVSLAEVLAEDYQAILYDQRGTGRSLLNTVNGETLTLDNMVSDIERIRQHLGYDEWIVLGHSFGGMLASYYATKHPEKLKGLILSSSGGVDLQLFESLNIRSRLNVSQRDSLQYWSRRIAEGDTSYQARFHRGKFLAPAYLHDTAFIDQVAHRLTQSNMTINRLVWQNMQQMNFDCKPALRDFQRPVLILQGEYDVLDIEIPKTAHFVFPNSKLVILPDTAHYGWLESPDQYFSEIYEFLIKLGR